MKLELSQQQVQTVSPQVALTMRLLQYNTQELRTFLETEALENPLLELEDPKPSEEEALLLQEYRWLSERGPYRFAAGATERREYGDAQYGTTDNRENSLGFHLKSQLYACCSDAREIQAAEWIIDNLDTNGFYESSPEVEPFDAVLRERALRRIRSFDPAGIGAEDIRHCLLLQLERLPGDHQLAKRVVSEYLDAFAKSHFHFMATELGVSQSKLREACDEIRTLHPRPSAGFDSAEQNLFLQPDIAFVAFDGKPTVLLLEKELPEITLNPYYCELLQNSSDTEVLDYLREKLRRVNWLRQSIQQRRTTLQRCTDAMIRRQRAFFLENGAILPLTMKEIADEIGVHESTVSRAVSGKCIQCSRGVFPMERFFARNVGGGNTGFTPAQIQDAIAVLIRREDKKRPLSDQQICTLLAKDHMEISRRTVAKYRMELGILPASGRRLM